VTGGTNSIEKAIVKGSTFGGCKLVGTQETLHATAEVTQDSTIDGFLYFSPEDTVDIITVIAEGTTPHLETDAVYSEEKVRAVQIK
jgi:DNA-binding LacI/PurR family transcriptional regulator